MAWSIEAKWFEIIGSGRGHLYIEVFDDSGSRVTQYNALGTQFYQRGQSKLKFENFRFTLTPFLQTFPTS